MKTAFCTHCSDDWYEPVGCYKLEQSLRRFHPEIPFFRFGSKEIAEQLRAEPRLHWDVMIPIWGKLLAREYDLVVHFDADSIVTGHLTELLSGDFEVAGVRNNDDFGDLQMSCRNVTADQYLNCGLVAARSVNFWDEWYHENFASAHTYPVAENDVFNQIFYSGRYESRVLDAPNADCYYGHAALRSRWKEIELRDDRLYLRGKQVKVLHEAGGHHLPKLRLVGEFADDVLRWLFRLTNSPYIVDSSGQLCGLGHPHLVNLFFERSSHLSAVIREVNESTRLLEKLRQYGTVVDVGAHVGAFSAFISPSAKEVIACEPHPEFQKLLAMTTVHAGLRNVKLCGKAIWTRSGTKRLHLCPSNSTMASLVKTSAHGGESIGVPTVSVADLLEEYGCDTIDLLKMDIEGGEDAVVGDGSFDVVSARVRSAWIECHPIPTAGLSREDVANRVATKLQVLGFRIERVGDHVYAEQR